MFKKLVGAVLLFATLCLLFAGCGKTDLDKSAEYMEEHPLKEDKLYTISFALVTDDALDATALSEMQKQFNEYSETHYNIRVEFINKTAAEYAAWLDTKLSEVAAARAAKEASAGNAGTAEVTTAGGNLGSDVRNVYPELQDDQLDIIYIEDYDMLRSLAEAGKLRNLTAELNTLDYRLIKSNMTENFFLNAKVGGKVLGVPNCRVMADYNYMLVDVAKAKYFNYTSKENFTDYASTADLRAAITAASEDPDTFVKKDVSGTYADRETLAEDGKYWVYATATEQYPTVKQSDLCESMLAISSFAFVDDGGTKLTDTDDYCPAVRILYEVNSNKDLHTILHYGVRGGTYNLTKESTVTLITETEMTYSVDTKYTGNLFSIYPLDTEVDVVDDWKLQNRETVVTPDIFTVSVSTNNEKSGTASANINFGKVGETCTLTANALEGATFSGWKHSENDKDFLSTELELTVTVAETGNSYIAIFSAE